MNPKAYRDYLYRMRAHPGTEGADPAFVDQRDSFGRVYLSILPFILAEYWVEVGYPIIPSGLVFPMGYLLFWGYYYTFYEPGFLEDHLRSPFRLNLLYIPSLLIGVAIWFVKVTLSELISLFSPFRTRPQPAPAAARPRPVRTEGTFAGSRPAPLRRVRTLPPDVLTALYALGLDESAGWGDIHHRYRELAKRFHPDLNPDITEAGNRFMAYDSAYRRLATVKSRYFGAK